MFLTAKAHNLSPYDLIAGRSVLPVGAAIVLCFVIQIIHIQQAHGDLSVHWRSQQFSYKVSSLFFSAFLVLYFSNNRWQ